MEFSSAKILAADRPSEETVLRRKQDTALADAPEVVAAPYPESEASGIERRRHPRVSMDQAVPDVDPDEEQRIERRKLDRRGLDALRAEIQWTYAEEAEGRGFGSSRRISMPRRSRMKPSRIALMVVALFSGGLAAFLATQNNQPAVEPTAAVAVAEVIQEPRTQVLVAKQSIGIGQHLLPASVGWEEWPAGSVLADYVTIEDAPDAVTGMADSVARFEFFAGDPIRSKKLVQANQGYLSAILGSGMRGVSVSVAAESASGGFISPNDHVDVVLTRSSAANEVSETILHNVRVLAINTRLGETGTTGASTTSDDPDADPRAEVFVNQAIATLELDAAKAEVIIGATAVGQLSLVLRAMTDFAEDAPLEQRGSNQAIKISSPFWTGAPSTQVR